MNSLHSTADLLSLDLNLLSALDSLLETRSVTKAASLAGISQSAMSHTLRRLRDVFGDQLLVRAGTHMVLSPRADTLRVPLRAALLSLARAIEAPPAFDPMTAERDFRIVSPDLLNVLVLPELLSALAGIGPGIGLTVSGDYSALSERLTTGDLDLAVLPILLGSKGQLLVADLSSDLRQRALLHDGFKCFVRKRHPVLTKARSKRAKLTAARYSKLGHIQVSPGKAGVSFVDRALAERGLERRIVLRVPEFATALSIAAASDLVLTAPSALLECPQATGLVALTPPLALPKHAITLVWHPRFSQDLGHLWLREQLSAAVEVIRANG